jgi:hypothetical protein
MLFQMAHNGVPARIKAVPAFFDSDDAHVHIHHGTGWPR